MTTYPDASWTRYVQAHLLPQKFSFFDDVFFLDGRFDADNSIPF